MSGISVIIPTCNRRSTIKRAVDSVLSQTLRADEVIIVDDGSTDGTAALIRRDYPGLTLLTQENQGVSAARNAGIRRAAGQWLAFLDSDDVWHPEKLARQVKQLKAQPQYLLVHSDEIWMRRGVRVNPMKKHKKHGGHIFRHCLPLCAISPSSVLIHAAVFAQVGLFDERFPVCEDYDMWLRICARHPVLFVNEALITKYGGHADQLSRRLWGMDRFRIRALDKLLKDEVLGSDDRAAAVAMLQEKISIYLRGAKKHGNAAALKEMSGLLNSYRAAAQHPPL